MVTNVKIVALSLLILIQGLTFVSLDDLFNGRVLTQFSRIFEVVYHLNIAFLLH